MTVEDVQRTIPAVLSEPNAPRRLGGEVVSVNGTGARLSRRYGRSCRQGRGLQEAPRDSGTIPVRQAEAVCAQAIEIRTPKEVLEYG